MRRRRGRCVEKREATRLRRLSGQPVLARHHGAVPAIAPAAVRTGRAAQVQISPARRDRWFSAGVLPPALTWALIAPAGHCPQRVVGKAGHTPPWPRRPALPPQRRRALTPRRSPLRRAAVFRRRCACHHSLRLLSLINPVILLPSMATQAPRLRYLTGILRESLSRT